MAYMSQEKKAKIVAAVKPILKKYGIKGSFAVRNHSTIVLTLKQGKIDFVENYIQTDMNSPVAKKITISLAAKPRDHPLLRSDR